MMRSPFMLKPGWFEPDCKNVWRRISWRKPRATWEWRDDRVRMALADAT